ncbi:hypothetical protein GCM10027269_43560 [Kribbella endophytica]
MRGAGYRALHARGAGYRALHARGAVCASGARHARLRVSPPGAVGRVWLAQRGWLGWLWGGVDGLVGE